MEHELKNQFEKFAIYAKAQGASEEEIQEMKIGLLDTIIQSLFTHKT